MEKGSRVVLDDALRVVGVERERLPQGHRRRPLDIWHQLEIDPATRGGQFLLLRRGSLPGERESRREPPGHGHGEFERYPAGASRQHRSAHRSPPNGPAAA